MYHFLSPPPPDLLPETLIGVKGEPAPMPAVTSDHAPVPMPVVINDGPPRWSLSTPSSDE